MSPRERRTYCVYIMGSLSGTLYVGVTGNLHQRVFQHKFHLMEGFTDRYDVERLLYWASYDDVHKGNRTREAVERVVQSQKDRADWIEEPALVGLGERLVSVDEDEEDWLRAVPLGGRDASTAPDRSKRPPRLRSA